MTLKLSDAFATKAEDFDDQFLEVKVRVININPKNHDAILEKSQTLKEYGLFIDTIRSYLDKGYSRDSAIESAIRDCIHRGILKEFLEKHGGEIYNMIFQEFNMETALEVAESEGLVKGRTEGIAAKALETAKNMKKEGFPSDVIARIVGLDDKTIQKL